jgi:LytS/YehU family sensor histidine kinase
LALIVQKYLGDSVVDARLAGTFARQFLPALLPGILPGTFAGSLVGIFGGIFCRAIFAGSFGASEIKFLYLRIVQKKMNTWCRV